VRESDKPQFMTIMQTLEYVCRDPLDSLQKEVYWLVLSPRCTLGQFEKACLEVLAVLKDHCVPMPGVFLEALDQVRARALDDQAAEKRRLAELEHQHADQQKRRLLADPREAKAEEAARQQFLDSLNTILGANWRTIEDAMHAGATRTYGRKFHTSVCATET
jgi:hypothetical protein